MTVYELNKSAMSAKPDMDADAIASKETMITDFFNNTDNDCYMLLCRERNDYTLFYNELYENSIEQLIEENVVFDYERDTSIIDGVLTLCDDIIILPIWQDGISSYNVSYKDISYEELNYNTLGNLEMFKGVKINK